MDSLSKERRSANMAAIRSKNTKPEIAVRKFLFRHGIRFRLHGSGLPGKPDIVIQRDSLAIFVHGCFWHGCKKCVDGKRSVKSNSAYWSEKVSGNQARDRRHRKALSRTGWHALTIWECEVTNPRRLDFLLSKVRRLRDAAHNIPAPTKKRVGPPTLGQVGDPFNSRE